MPLRIGRALICISALLTVLGVVSACGSSPSASQSTPATTTGGSGEQTLPPKDLGSITVAVASPAGDYIPLFVADAQHTFQKHGLTVKVVVLSASASVQGLVSGSLQIYAGGTTVAAAAAQGTKLEYVGTAQDKSPLELIVRDSIGSISALQGKTIATTSPGAFGEIAMRKLANENGLTIPDDLKLAYNASEAAAVSEFVSHRVDGVIVDPPATNRALKSGRLLVNFHKQGLRLIGPGFAVLKPYASAHAAQLTAFLEGYLDGVKIATTEPQTAKADFGKLAGTSDEATLDETYEESHSLWNKDLCVSPDPINTLLKYAPTVASGKVKLTAQELYDNSYIRAVNKSYGKDIFPDVHFSC